MTVDLKSTPLEPLALQARVVQLFVVPTISFRLLYVCGMTDVGFCGWGRPRIQLQNGSPGSLLRPVDGTRLRAISCATAIDPMVRYSSDVFASWGSEIDPHPRGRRGRSGGSVLIT